MFDVLMNLMVIPSFGFPAVPWFFGARWGRRGIWLSTGFAVIALCLFPPLFFAACIASNCGQGAIAIFVLAPIWIVSGLLTMSSAAFADYTFVARRHNTQGQSRFSAPFWIGLFFFIVAAGAAAFGYWFLWM